ncbi:MAG: type II toxin-antitoxin system VapB family antitoxin [Gemmatimonadaceae bacterium]
MKTTVDIPDDELKEAMRFSGAATKRDAIVTAIVEFNRRHRAEEFIRVFGTFTSIMSNEEIEAEQTRQEDERLRGAD